MYNLTDMLHSFLLSFIEFTQLVILTQVYILQLLKAEKKETFILNKSNLVQRQMVLD